MTRHASKTAQKEWLAHTRSLLKLNNKWVQEAEWDSDYHEKRKEMDAIFNI